MIICASVYWGYSCKVLGSNLCLIDRYTGNLGQLNRYKFNFGSVLVYDFWTFPPPINFVYDPLFFSKIIYF